MYKYVYIYTRTQTYIQDNSNKGIYNTLPSDLSETSRDICSRCLVFCVYLYEYSVKKYKIEIKT